MRQIIGCVAIALAALATSCSSSEPQSPGKPDGTPPSDGKVPPPAQTATAPDPGKATLIETKISESNAPAYERGLREFQASNFAVALEMFETIIDSQPNYLDAYGMASISAIYGGEYEKSEKFSRKALEFQPDNFDHLKLLGMALKMEKKPEEALVVYKRALKINKKDPQLLINMAGTLADLKNWEQALQMFFDAGMYIDPADIQMVAQSEYGIALCYSHLGYGERGMERLEKALKLDPKNEMYKALHEEMVEILKKAEKEKEKEGR